MANSSNRLVRLSLLVILLICTVPVFAQESACSVLPGEMIPAVIPVDTLPLWRLLVGQGSWVFDSLTGKFEVSVKLINAGEERIRGAGAQIKVLDGSGRVLATAWKLIETIYLEAHASANIHIELQVGPGSFPAQVLFESIQVMGSCGW